MPTPLSDTTLISAAWNLVRDVLTDASTGITDTLATPRAATAFVKAQFPDLKTHGTDWEFPMVIVGHPKPGQEQLTVDASKHTFTHAVAITIWARSNVDLDTLGDRVVNVMRSQQRTFHVNGLKHMRLASSSSEVTITENDMKLYFLTLNYEWENVV